MARVNVSVEQLQTIIKANEEVKGTPHYARYQMECTVKMNGRWLMTSWSVPRIATAFNGAYLKRVKDDLYIYCQEGYDEYGIRYYVTKNVADLMGWEL